MTVTLFNSNNALINNIYSSLQAQNTILELKIINKVIDLEKISNGSTLIFFLDPYLDNIDNDLSLTLKIIDTCEKKNLKLIYIDTVHLYGHTEKTSVLEDHIMQPFNKLGRHRLAIYTAIMNADKNFRKLILRFPDLLGKNTNYFFNRFFDNRSNFIIWPGPTFINHEFIAAKDAVSLIVFTINNPDIIGEYNISGYKFTLEQIAASISELSGRAVKIQRLSPLVLFIKSLFNKSDKVIYDTKYIYEKPIFLNSTKFDTNFKQSHTKENSINEIVNYIIQN